MNALDILISAKDNASQVLDSIRSKVDSLGEQGSKAFTSIDSAAAAVRSRIASLYTAVGALVAAFATSMLVKVPALFESITAQLKTLTRSSSGAQDAMNWVTDFAKNTPYELDKVSQAYSKLASYGFDPKTILEPIGNAASGMQKELDQAVEAYADATRGEFERLKEFGVNAATVGNQVTFTWMQNGQQMEKTVTKNADSISKALTGIWNDMFKGAMGEQMSTFTGRVSNMFDALTRGIQKFMGAGLFESIKQKISEVTDAVEQVSKSGQLEEWGKKAAAGLDYIWGAAKRLVEMVTQFVTDYGGLIKIVATVAAFNLAVGAFGSLLSAVTKVSQVLNIFKTASAAAQVGTIAVTKAILAGAAGWVGLALAIPDAVEGYKNAALALNEWLNPLSKTNQANKMAAQLQTQANETNQKAVTILNQVAKQYGLSVASMEDWKAVLPEITRQMRENGQVVGLTAEEYKALQETLKKAQTAGTAYLSQVSDRYDYEIKAAEKLAETEGAAAANGLAAQRDKYKGVLQVAQSVAATLNDLIDKSAANESQKANLRKQVEKDLQAAKKQALEDWLSALKSGLDQALEQEKRYAQEVRDAKETTSKTIREINRQGMDSAASYGDILAEAREKLAKAKAEEAKGTAEGYDNAVKLAKEVESMASSSVSAGKEVVGIGEAVKNARDLASEAGDIWKSAAENGKQAWADSAAAFLQQIKEAKVELEDLKNNPITAKLDVDTSKVDTALDRLASTVTTSEHTVSPETTIVDAKITELKKDTHSTHTIYVQEVQQKAFGGPVRNVPAMVMPGEVVIPPEYASRMPGLLHAVNTMRLPVPKLADGGVFRPFRSGLVPGVGDEDSEPVLLPEGAFVVRKAAVNLYGADWLQSLAADGSVPHFAAGGRVSLGNLAALQGGIRLPDWLEQLRLARPAAPAAAEATAPEAPVAPASPAPLAIAVARPDAFRAMTTPLAGKRDMTARGTSALGRLNGLRHAASLKFATGGSLDETLADIALERQRTQEDYDEAVAEAQTNHDDDLADLLKQEQEDLDSIAEELASTLKELQETLQDAQKQYQEDLADAQDQYNDAAAAYKEFLYNPTITYSSKNNVGNSVLMSTEDVDKDNGTYYSPATYSQYASGGFVTRYKKQYLSSFSYGIPTRWKWAPYKDYSSSSISEDRSLRAAIEDAKAQIAEVKATWATAQSDYSTGVTDAKQTAVEDTASTKTQATEDTDDLNTDLEKTLADLQKDFDRSMEDLDIQEARARANAEDEGTYSISGFTSWLRDGGPVKALLKHFALGGPVKAGLARLFPGLPRFEDGGVAPMLPGAVPGQDSILAALTPGEGIINLPAMRRLISERALQALNAMDLPGFLDALPHYADGGIAGLTESARTAAAMGPSSASSGESYSATLNLQIGGKSYETRAARSTARELAKELRRQGVNVR